METAVFPYPFRKLAVAGLSAQQSADPVHTLLQPLVCQPAKLGMGQGAGVIRERWGGLWWMESNQTSLDPQLTLF